MATRNLTKRFLEIRNASKANRSLNRGSFAEGDGYDSGLLNKVTTFNKKCNT